MAKNFLLICNGVSGSGKTYFIEHIFGNYAYNLKSFTTREMRAGEVWGQRYYYVDEAAFDKEPLATHLFVNQAFWQPGDKKWLYGVPEFEIMHNLGHNLVYDVIQPRYSRELIDWFTDHGLDKYYDYKVLWFLPSKNAEQTVKERANMPNDTDVRRINTCDAIDFLRAGLQPDYILKSGLDETIVLPQVEKFLACVTNTPYNDALKDRAMRLTPYELRARQALKDAKQR